MKNAKCILFVAILTISFASCDTTSATDETKPSSNNGSANDSTAKDTNNSGTVRDIDGNVYKTMKIGKQTWMLENLRVETLRNGTRLTKYDDATQWWQNSVSTSTPAYCMYQNDGYQGTTYGYIYNYNAVSTGKLAPDGWHIPTDEEWTEMQEYLSAHGGNYDGSTTGNKVGKTIAASSGWLTSSNIGAVGNDQSKNNTSKFNGLAGGYRDDNGVYQAIGNSCFWWTSSFSSGKFAYYIHLSYLNASLIHSSGQSGYSGYYVRCVKN